jgi:hypothetical protein
VDILTLLFEYVSAAKRAGVSSEELDRLIALTRAEFPGDELVVKLHVLRAVQAVERGDVTLPLSATAIQTHYDLELRKDFLGDRLA